MLNLLIGRDWISNRREILNRISADVAQRRDNRLLLVPELISHELERLLCAAAGNTASRYAEVLSFSRLARRVSDYTGLAPEPCLDKGGRVVAMAAAARQLSSRLKAYAAVETKPEFLTGLIDAIDEFKRCCITPQDLSHASRVLEGSFSQKLEELSLIMEAYDSLCSRGKRDPRDQQTWLLEQLENCDFAREYTFYIDGFPDFTRQNMAIISHLIENSPSVTISLNCDSVSSSTLAFEKAGLTAQEIFRIAHNLDVPVHVEVISELDTKLQPVRDKLFQGAFSSRVAGDCLKTIRAESPFRECMDAAQLVQDLVTNGSRYRDISIVCTDIDVYKPLVDLVFHRMQIPLYCSGTEQILQKSVIHTVLTAIEAALSGFEQRNVFRYLRSALSPIDPDQCDHVENYCVIWGIRGRKWLQIWTNHPDGLSDVWTDQNREHLAKLNDARERAMTPLAHLELGFRNARNVQEQVIAVYCFLEEIHLEKRLAELSDEMNAAGDNRSAQILNQLWEILLSALEQLYDVLGDISWNQEHFVRLFRLLLSQYDVGTIPPVLDAVQMGSVSAMRCHTQKHLIVLGAEEGKLPGYSGSSGVLTDQERVTLRELGVPLTGGAMEGIQAEFAEIYGVFCGATETVTVYCSGEQPSFLFRRLVSLSGCTAGTGENTGFATANPFEAGAYLVRWNAEKEASELGILDAFQDAASRSAYALGSLREESIRSLYGSTLNLSASQIDRLAECRLSYFLKYGLRVQERKEIAVDPAEFGTYVHAVLENTARCVQEMGGFRQVTLEETMNIAHRFSEEYAAERFGQIDSERMIYLFKRNIHELDMVVEELWKELKDSWFEPVGFEVAFGDTGGLPPIPIPNTRINAILRGFVDRVDIWNSPGSSYYRVVDYKTGKKDFDYCDIFNGVGLQMLLYLFALRKSGDPALGDHPAPAGVQYFPARVPYITTDGSPDEKALEKDRDAIWKRRGLLLHDEAVLQAMEPGENPRRMCYSVKKDGTYTGDLADRDQLKLLERYVFHTLKKLVEDVASGNVTPNPYTRGSSHSACSFCPYGSICHETNVEERRNYKTMTSQRFWEEVGKEMR